MPTSMPCTLTGARSLRFDDGEPVRAASGVTRFEDGWLVVSDDAVHAAHWTPRGIGRVRVLAPVEGHEHFDEAAGTKHLKPDLEAACRVTIEGRPAALLLGSGSLPARTRVVLIRDGSRQRRVADLPDLYRRASELLELPPDQLNLEGACVVGGELRWFQRGNRRLEVPSSSVDVDLGALLAAVAGRTPAAGVPVGSPRRYDVEDLDAAGLAITDALALPDGRVLASAAAEDTPNAVDDGPVIAAALLLIDDEAVVATAELPDGPAGPEKVEGLALVDLDGATARLRAVVDADDPAAPSRALDLTVVLP